MNTHKPILFVLVVVALTLAAATSSAAELFGKSIPDSVPTVKLADIMKNPAAYKDKEVVLHGNYAGHCCATDFNYKEGLNGVECYYPGFDVPKTKPGRPVTVYALVRVRGSEAAESNTADAEKKTEPKAESSKPEAEKGKELQVSLEAKGVQFK